jgi:hypothetical protein
VYKVHTSPGTSSLALSSWCTMYITVLGLSMVQGILSITVKVATSRLQVRNTVVAKAIRNVYFSFLCDSNFLLINVGDRELESAKRDVELDKHRDTMKNLTVFFFFVPILAAQNCELFETSIYCFVSGH